MGVFFLLYQRSVEKIDLTMFFKTASLPSGSHEIAAINVKQSWGIWVQKYAVSYLQYIKRNMPTGYDIYSTFENNTYRNCGTQLEPLTNVYIWHENPELFTMRCWWCDSVVWESFRSCYYVFFIYLLSKSGNNIILHTPFKQIEYQNSDASGNKKQ